MFAKVELIWNYFNIGKRRDYVEK